MQQASPPVDPLIHFPLGYSPAEFLTAGPGGRGELQHYKDRDRVTAAQT
jgi:hypothetical protein